MRLDKDDKTFIVIITLLLIIVFLTSCAVPTSGCSKRRHKYYERTIVL